MTSHHMDREALEEAIYRGSIVGAGSTVMMPVKVYRTLQAAAQAHLATLPKSKTVECFHIEWASNLGGKWFPEVAARNTERAANEYAASKPREAMARVTGPHKQEVPA